MANFPTFINAPSPQGLQPMGMNYKPLDYSLLLKSLLLDKEGKKKTESKKKNDRLKGNQGSVDQFYGEITRAKNEISFYESKWGPGAKAIPQYIDAVTRLSSLTSEANMNVVERETELLDRHKGIVEADESSDNIDIQLFNESLGTDVKTLEERIINNEMYPTNRLSGAENYHSDPNNVFDYSFDPNGSKWDINDADKEAHIIFNAANDQYNLDSNIAKKMGIVIARGAGMSEHLIHTGKRYTESDFETLSFANDHALSRFAGSQLNFSDPLVGGIYQDFIKKSNYGNSEYRFTDDKGKVTTKPLKTDGALNDNWYPAFADFAANYLQNFLNERYNQKLTDTDAFSKIPNEGGGGRKGKSKEFIEKPNTIRGESNAFMETPSTAKGILEKETVGQATDFFESYGMDLYGTTTQWEEFGGPTIFDANGNAVSRPAIIQGVDEDGNATTHIRDDDGNLVNLFGKTGRDTREDDYYPVFRQTRNQDGREVTVMRGNETRRNEWGEIIADPDGHLQNPFTAIEDSLEEWEDDASSISPDGDAVITKKWQKYRDNYMDKMTQGNNPNPDMKGLKAQFIKNEREELREIKDKLDHEMETPIIHNQMDFFGKSTTVVYSLSNNFKDDWQKNLVEKNGSANETLKDMVVQIAPGSQHSGNAIQFGKIVNIGNKVEQKYRGQARNWRQAKVQVTTELADGSTTTNEELQWNFYDNNGRPSAPNFTSGETNGFLLPTQTAESVDESQAYAAKNWDKINSPLFGTMGNFVPMTIEFQAKDSKRWEKLLSKTKMYNNEKEYGAGEIKGEIDSKLFKAYNDMLGLTGKPEHQIGTHKDGKITIPSTEKVVLAIDKLSSEAFRNKYHIEKAEAEGFFKFMQKYENGRIRKIDGYNIMPKKGSREIGQLASAWITHQYQEGGLSKEDIINHKRYAQQEQIQFKDFPEGKGIAGFIENTADWEKKLKYYINPLALSRLKITPVYGTPIGNKTPVVSIQYTILADMSNGIHKALNPEAQEFYFTNDFKNHVNNMEIKGRNKKLSHENLMQIEKDLELVPQNK